MERIEIRDGKEYRVTVLPEAAPPEARSHNSRFKLADVGKNPDASPSRPLRAGSVPQEKRDELPQSRKTKYPFAALINGEPVTVWVDHIEYEPDSIYE